ncbi:MAG TPA: hypothetical protein VMQ61_12615 [Thermoanaerobaculia bacterium]|nr:hypothetical protein [Thermoanaerobaculia bacterium]
MKRFLAAALVIGFAISAVALADHKMGGDKAMSGTITKVDAAQKTMVVKDSAGKETTLYWNDQTKIDGGAPKEGAMIHYKAQSKDGKMWATWVKSGDSGHKM